MGQWSRVKGRDGKGLWLGKAPKAKPEGGAPKVKLKMKLKRVKMKRVMIKRVKTKRVKLKRVKM